MDLGRLVMAIIFGGLAWFLISWFMSFFIKDAFHLLPLVVIWYGLYILLGLKDPDTNF